MPPTYVMYAILVVAFAAVLFPNEAAKSIAWVQD
jgi:hypothetical protein